MTQKHATLKTFKETTSNKTMSTLTKSKLISLSHRHQPNFCLNNMQPLLLSNNSSQAVTLLLENLLFKHMKLEMHQLKLLI